jgi:hypothetical protein
LDRVLFIMRQAIGGRQRGDMVAEAVQRVAVLDEVLGIGLAVATEVGEAVRLGGVGPPVISVGLEIIAAAFAEFRRVSGDGQRRRREGAPRGGEDAPAFHRSNEVNRRGSWAWVVGRIGLDAPGQR